jgi:hypothetical protein
VFWGTGGTVRVITECVFGGSGGTVRVITECVCGSGNCGEQMCVDFVVIGCEIHYIVCFVWVGLGWSD